MERTPTKGVAVRLYVQDKASGTAFHERYLRDLGFPRNRYPNADFYTDYDMNVRSSASPLVRLEEILNRSRNAPL